MLNGICFDRMKPNAVFLNTGRGAQVVESDLCRALTEQPERTAVLDVTFPEPPEDHSPLYTLPNVFLTPHIAGSKGDEVHRMSEYMLEQFRNITAGRPVRWEVDLNMLETMA
jgi:phosphoglycerate dehydrogenase-like enzyme